MSESRRDAVWAQLPERLAVLSARVRLLPWVQEELVAWVRDSIVARLGTWVVGPPGAVAQFPCAGDVLIDVRVEPGIVTAERADAAFRLRINEKVRAFAFAEGGPIVLGLPKGRAALDSVSTFKSLGPDVDAIDEAARGASLFDIGLGRRYSRFCLRTQSQPGAAMLSAQSGRHWSEALSVIQDQLPDANSYLVVESAAARIEVFAKLPSAGEAWPPDAGTHFLPELLGTGEDIAASLILPDYAAPVAIFYPDKY
jgi:hypothetical protein